MKCVTVRSRLSEETRGRFKAKSGKAKNGPRPFPLNKRVFTPPSDAKAREILRDKKKGVDPYKRLEFFTKEDLSPISNTKTKSTALPVSTEEDDTLVPITKVREHVLDKLEDMRIRELKRQYREGLISDADLEEIKRIQYEMSKDTSTAAMIDSMLHNNDTTYAIFPDATEAETVDRSQMSLVEQLTFDYNVPGYIEFEEMDVNGKETTVVHLSHCNGEEVLIDLNGARIVSWKGEDGRERLAVSDQGSGIPMAFPNFGRTQNLLFDGFANRMQWEVVRAEIGADWIPDPAPSVTLRCQDTSWTREMWPHSFEVFYKITLGEDDEFGKVAAPRKEQRRYFNTVNKLRSAKLGTEEYLEEVAMENSDSDYEFEETRSKEKKEESEDDEESDLSSEIANQLTLQVAVRNTGQLVCRLSPLQTVIVGDKPMKFSLAFRSYFRTRGVTYYGDYISILGLGGRTYIDYNIVRGKPILRFWDRDYLTMADRDDGWNAIYTENIPNDVFFCPGWPEYYESITRKESFPDVLVHQLDVRELESDNTTMVGRGRITVPVILQPGETWEGEYVLRHHDQMYPEPVFGYHDVLPPPADSDIDPRRRPRGQSLIVRE